MSDLRSAVDLFCERQLEGRSGSELAQDLVDIRFACDRLEVEFSLVAAKFAQTDEYDDQGSVSPIDWIRHNCKMSGHAAAERLCVGEEIDKLPESVEAVQEGRIGFAHLALMARTGRAISESPAGRDFDDTSLLPLALETSVSRFRHLCYHARHAQDPEGYAADEVLGVELPELEMNSGEDGLLYMRGVLDAAGGAILRTALEPLACRQGADDNRLHVRRLADALVELAHHALDTGVVPQRASQRTHMQVTLPAETLLAIKGAAAADLEYSRPISVRVVERLACDSTVTRILLGPGSAVVDVGRAMRVVPGSTRRALNVRDNGCRWPGCDRPAAWTAAHHMVHWTRGGPTNLSNLVLLCHRHHWLVHEGRWQIVRTDDNRILTIPPPSTRIKQSARAPDEIVAA